ncbi:MAG: NAD(P)/FAD-dependent oxidoreductase [Dehalococcoidia bacterium]|nr:NAD(P)/FAD-dependent oxidoreductase [Dehalococcoidia bacterium]
MHNSNKFDVIVIGAGFAGCYAAMSLAQLGYDVCVLEKNSRAGCKSSCTGIISKACLELLPAAKSAVQFETFSAKIFSPSGMMIRVKRDSPQAYVVDRPSLDRSLAEQAAEKGALFRFSTLVGSINVQSRFAEVYASCHDQLLILQTSIIIIACGAGTTLTRDAGLGQIRRYAQGAQTEITFPNLDEVEVYSGRNIAPGFFCWLVPAGNSRVKAGLLSRVNPRPYITAFLRKLEKQGRISCQSPEVKYGIVPIKPLSHTYGERTLVIGDAAGQVKPTTGGGIYFGLLCANIAVETIHEALQSGNLSARFLSSYQKKWHKLLKQELSIDYWAHRFYRGLNDKQVDHIFSVIERHRIHESILSSPDVTFDWHGKVIFDALKYRSLQRSLEKLGMPAIPSTADSKANRGRL